MSFGEFDYSNVEAGEEGLNYYDNAATEHWAIMMDDVQYGDVEIQTSTGAKIAYIDSGNTSIQVPQDEFNLIKA